MITWRSPVACWEPEHAERLIPVEAEALPDELFQATHVPLQLSRVSSTSPTTSDGESVTEADVLAEILRRLHPQARKTDIFPILGASGAGKSHLVRWLRNELRTRRDVSNVRYVFIPKHRTSLRGVVASIMDAFSDIDEVNDLRDELLSAQDEAVSEQELRARMRDALCNGLEYHAERTTVHSVNGQQVRDYLARELPVILRDPHFAPRYLADDGAIARLVEEKRSGRRGDDAVEHSFQFSSVEVAVSVDDVSHAAKRSQDVANQLASNPSVADVSLREFAARMLNDQLPGAIKEVFGIGGDDLRDLFVEVRRVLAAQDEPQDIFLLIEDFAMFQGLQSGLVDAITLASSVTQELCHLITVVAVTTGYYTNVIPETVKTRASCAFVVAEQGPEAPAKFAARYLRAIRLRTTERDVATTRGSSCDDCPVMSECHDAFGEVEGEGLFPFNRVLLDRGVDSQLENQFNARSFLTRVMRPVLIEEHPYISTQEHPTQRIADYFDARAYSPPGDAMMRLRSRDQGDRRERLALLYKDPVDEGDLLAPIHAAFGLPPLGIVGTTVSCAQADCQLPATKGRFCADHAPEAEAGGHHDERPVLVAAVDSWKRGQVLAQTHRAKIRQLVTQAVWARIEFADGAYRPSAWGHNTSIEPRFDTSIRARSVVIDGNRPQGRGWAQLEVSSANPDDVDAVQALAWLDAARTWRNVPNGIHRAARLEKTLRAWTADVEGQLGLHSKVDDELVSAALALEATAGLAGLGLVPTKRADRLVRLRARVDTSSDQWPGARNIAEALHNDREVLMELLDRRLAYAQGPGAPAAYDAHATKRLFDLMGDATIVQGDGKTAVSKALKAIARHLNAVDGWGEKLLEELPDTAVLGGESPKALLTDLDEVAQRGQASAELRRSARNAAEAVRESDIEVVAAARAELARWEQLSLVERTALAGGTWFGAAQRIGDFVSRSVAVLQAATPGNVTLEPSDRSTVETDWASALGRLESVIGQLREALR